MDEQGRSAAAVVNAALIDFGIITGDKSCDVDRRRIRRAKPKFRQQANAAFNEPGERYLGHVTTDDKKAGTICDALLEL